MNTMPCPVGFPFPFQLLIRNVDPGAGCEHSLAVSDDGDIVITGNLERVRLKRIGFAAT
jgi:hypothetical protein